MTARGAETPLDEHQGQDHEEREAAPHAGGRWTESAGEALVKRKASTRRERTKPGEGRPEQVHVFTALDANDEEASLGTSEVRAFETPGTASAKGKTTTMSSSRFGAPRRAHR